MSALSRPMLSKPKRDDLKLEAAQRQQMRDRDCKNGRPICRLEKRVGRSWRECGNAATDMAHILPRNVCGKVSFDVRVVILACRDCHDGYDYNYLSGETPRYEVRVPVKLARPAYALVVANTKSLPPAKYNPDV